VTAREAVESQRIRCKGRGSTPRVGRLRREGPESPYVGGRTLKWLRVKQPSDREAERGWDARNKS
jgi:hypothetical protein